MSHFNDPARPGRYRRLPLTEAALSLPNDPLLQPFQLKHLTLKNRVMSTSHEPAYSEDGHAEGALPALPRWRRPRAASR